MLQNVIIIIIIIVSCPKYIQKISFTMLTRTHAIGHQDLVNLIEESESESIDPRELAQCEDYSLPSLPPSRIEHTSKAHTSPLRAGSTRSSPGSLSQSQFSNTPTPTPLSQSPVYFVEPREMAQCEDYSLPSLPPSRIEHTSKGILPTSPPYTPPSPPRSQSSSSPWRWPSNFSLSWKPPDFSEPNLEPEVPQQIPWAKKRTASAPNTNRRGRTRGVSIVAENFKKKKKQKVKTTKPKQKKNRSRQK